MKIAFLLFDRALSTGISLPAEMFASASALRPRKEQKQQPLKLEVIAQTLEPQKVSAGITVSPTATLNEHDWDLVMVPPMWGNPKPVLAKQGELISWLAQLPKHTQIIAIGTGACLLAESGRLNNKVATTHWYYFNNFAQQYPKIKLQKKAFITAADELFCAGSINSASELVLWFIKNWWGEHICSVIEKHYGHEISRTYDQPFFIEGGGAQFDEDIAFAQNYMKQNFQKPLTAASIAAACDMSLRSFNRHFKASLGMTPLAYLQNLRLSAARELLKDVNLSLDEVSHAVGYRDSSYFSRLFAKHMEMTAAEYRNLVRAKLFTS